MSEQRTTPEEVAEEFRRLGLIREAPGDIPVPQSGGDHSPLAMPQPPTQETASGERELPDPPLMVQPAPQISQEAQASIEAILRGPMMIDPPQVTPLTEAALREMERLNPFNWSNEEAAIAAKMNPHSAIIPDPPKPAAEPVKVGRKCACGKTMVHQLDWSNGKMPGWSCECGAVEKVLDSDLPRKRDWYHEVAVSIQRLVMHSSTNASTRALVEQLAGQRIPDHVKTLDDIQFWFERVPRTVIEQTIRIGLNRTTVARRRTPGFDVDISTTESESGTCRYSCTRRGSTEYTIEGSELLDIIRGCVEDEHTDEREILRRIRSYVFDAGVDVDTESDSDSYDHEEYEPRNTETTETNIDISANSFREWLRDNDEELYEAIYG